MGERRQWLKGPDRHKSLDVRPSPLSPTRNFIAGADIAGRSHDGHAMTGATAWAQYGGWT